MSIVSEVAQAYFELVALDNELNIVRQTLYAVKKEYAWQSFVLKED